MNENKKNGVKIACLSLAAAFACGALAGCDLVTTDAELDMAQEIAVVDISKGEEFQKEYAAVAQQNIIKPASILKRDLISNFLSYGYQYVQSYGYSYEDTFTMIKDSLVSRNMLLQYAKAEFLKVGSYDGQTFTVEGYNAAINGKQDVDADMAAVGYFLTDAERAKAEYTLKKSLNSSLDASEQSIIRLEDEDESETVEVRTLPTGVNTETEDYCPAGYQVYTGRNLLAECPDYEAVEGSTAATRKKAYNTFLSSLIENNLLTEGEDLTDVTKLNYYKLQTVAAYEDALLTKLSDLFEERAEATLTADYVNAKYTETLEAQKVTFAETATFETAYEGMSNSAFTLYVPEDGYGFVINILLPFSATQGVLSSGADYEYRAQLLKNLKATDQRESWITGETDYSYEKEGKTYFFEESVNASAGSKYEKLENYAGTYPFNGTVTYNEATDEYDIQKNKVDIDGFLAIMKEQLTAQGLSVSETKPASASYYDLKEDDYYNHDGKGERTDVDYSKFIYYQAKVDMGSDFSLNKLFVENTNANKAFSVVNELSFAYNTDTAGLNSYLGYSVSAFETSFVPEFEYAAKEAIKGGVGSYTVAPSQYGWHIMYCTFTSAKGEVYSFDYAQKDDEGCFSNLYYEALKSSAVSGFSSAIQTKVTNDYSSCVTLYQDRYQNLLDLDK